MSSNHRRCRGHRILCKLVALLLLFQFALSTSPADPYAVLGITRNDSDSAIRKQYHKLCLRYHPDKQGGKSQREKKRLEESFKKIQAAYAQINSAESRRLYDTQSSFQNMFGSHASGSSSFPTGSHDFESQFSDLFREFQRHNSAPDNPPHNPFVRVFSTRNSMFPQSSSFGKSVFQETVTVPLEMLYNGNATIRHSPRTGAWRRIVAAFRGGIAYPMMYTSLMYALPLLRLLGKQATLVVWVGMFVAQLPAATTVPTTLRVPIRAGYKPGTKLTFSAGDTVMSDVVLVLKASRHEEFTLVGNNLHTSVCITAKEARNGCSGRINRLGNDEPLEVMIPAGSSHGDLIRIQGEGWPIRKANREHYGDMLVHVRIKGRR